MSATPVTVAGLNVVEQSGPLHVGDDGLRIRCGASCVNRHGVRVRRGDFGDG